MRADWIRLMIAAARFPMRSEPAKSQFLRPRAHGRIWFSANYYQWYSPVIEVARQRCPAFQAVIEGFADSRAFGHEVTLGDHQVVQHVHHRYSFFLPY